MPEESDLSPATLAGASEVSAAAAETFEAVSRASAAPAVPAVTSVTSVTSVKLATSAVTVCFSGITSEVPDPFEVLLLHG